MDLYVLRHAIAVERGTPGFRNDFDRPLTAEGLGKLRRITRAMTQMELSFDLILSSPYVRAHQTAQLVAAELRAPGKMQFLDGLRADANPLQAVAELKRIRPLPKSLLLVGHEPNLSMLVSLFVTGAERPSLSFKKAGLCKLTVQSIRAGRCAKLDWLLTPKQMLLIK